MLMLLRRIASLFSSQQLRRYHALHFRELQDCVSSKFVTKLFSAKTDYHFELDFRYGIIVLFAVSMYYLCRYTLWINAYRYWYMNTPLFGRWMLWQVAFHMNNVDALVWAFKFIEFWYRKNLKPFIFAPDIESVAKSCKTCRLTSLVIMFQTRQVHNGSLHLSAPSATFATLSLWLKNQLNVWFNLITVCSIEPSLFHLSRYLSSKSKYPPLAESELEEKFIKGSGRGGQAVNKTNNCVQLTHKATGVVIKVS